MNTPSKSSPASAPPVSLPAVKSGPFIPHTAKARHRLAARILFAFARALASTIRFTVEDRAGILSDPGRGPLIFCFWHNRLALCTSVYNVCFHGNTNVSGLAAMVSASRDGAFLSAVLECFGVQPVRGSSSRRGPQALLELVTWFERNYDLAITPDGPRGPAYSIQPGVMSLAQLTGGRIIPVSYNIEGKIVLRSWDKFIIPLPFGGCHVIFEKPIQVPRDATPDDRAQLRLHLQQTLNAISKG
jgi:lysophospholipid acyltransferase (LPLAT)-like uncharacterized protein